MRPHQPARPGMCGQAQVKAEVRASAEVRARVKRLWSASWSSLETLRHGMLW